MEFGGFGKWLFYIGIFIALFGAVIWIGERTGMPFGKLPGDIHVRRENYSFHFPIATSIILSIVLTVVLNIVIRLFHK